MKKHVIFNQRVAGYLMLKKHVLKGIDKSKTNSKMNVFLFDDTDELRKAISEYDNFIASIQDHLS